MECRTALVIGNGNYTDERLKNPVNDATDIATALKSMGFIVTLKKDADLREMKEEIDNFDDSLKKGVVGLFLYAGHGIQVGGIKYLIPVRAKISNEKMISCFSSYVPVYGLFVVRRYPFSYFVAPAQGGMRG